MSTAVEYSAKLKQKGDFNLLRAFFYKKDASNSIKKQNRANL
jgi:hypothetical protein